MIRARLALIGLVLALAAVAIVDTSGTASAGGTTQSVPCTSDQQTLTCDLPLVTPTVTATVAATATATVTTTVPAPTGTPVVRAAFYYPWFAETWGRGAPFTIYNPTLGFYSSDDTAVIAQHVAAMRYAHMDAGISSWWGQGQHAETTRLAKQFAAVAGTTFKWGLYYEKEGFGDPAVSELTSDLNYIKANYISNPNFLTIKGKPVVFAYNDAIDNCSMNDRWKQANAATGNAFYVVLKVFKGYAACTSQPDSWHQYGPASGTHDFRGLSESISPGYYKKGDAGPLLVRDIGAWKQRITTMVNRAEPLQLITTFNEWGEGTAVESASEWSSASGYGAYVDALHDLIP